MPGAARTPQGKSERQARPEFIDRAFIRDRMPHGEIEGQCERVAGGDGRTAMSSVAEVADARILRPEEHVREVGDRVHAFGVMQRGA